MKVHITLKDTRSFTLENVIRIGIMKHMFDGKYRKIIYFEDNMFGILVYPLADIVEMITEG